MMSGLLPDAQISASSSRDVVWSPGTARLVASRSGWFPGPTQPIAGEEWLQVRRKILIGEVQPFCVSGWGFIHKIVKGNGVKSCVSISVVCKIKEIFQTFQQSTTVICRCFH